MRISVFIVFLLTLCFACKNESKNTIEQLEKNPNDLVFDKAKWKVKVGKDYLYRDKMFRDVIYNDTIRTLRKEQLFELLGEPDYIREEHLYYRITETRLGSWTLTTKTMVIKLINDESIEWIKIHE